MVWVYVSFASAAVAAVVVFGDSPSLRGTAVHRARRALLAANARALAALNRASVPPWLAWYANWFVPVFYGAALTFLLAVFFADVWPQVSPRYRHGCGAAYVYCSVAAVYGATGAATFSDPGRVTAQNVGRACEVFPANELIFFSDAWCRTCELPKPARSKHCSTCGRCVLVLDHHCVWLNNCVGHYNYRWFAAFLAANINMLVFGGVVCASALPSWNLVAAAADPAHKNTVMLAMLCGIFTPIVTVFAGFQARYVYLGVTTNELDKWGDVEHLAAIGALYTMGGRYVERVGDQFLDLGSEQVVPVTGRLSPVTDISTVPNIYDHGFRSNLAERVFPQTV